MLLDIDSEADSADGERESCEAPLRRSVGGRCGKASSEWHEELGDVEHDENLDSSASYLVIKTMLFLFSMAEYIPCLPEDVVLTDPIDIASEYAVLLRAKWHSMSYVQMWEDRVLLSVWTTLLIGGATARTWDLTESVW